MNNTVEQLKYAVIYYLPFQTITAVVKFFDRFEDANMCAKKAAADTRGECHIWERVAEKK